MLTGWKTLIVMVAAAVFGVLETFDFTTVLTAENAGYVVTGLGIAGTILRFLTNTPATKPTV